MSLETRKFELSVKNAIGIVLYCIFLELIIRIVSKYPYINQSNLIIESLISLAKEIIGKTLVLWLIFREIRTKYNPEFRLGIVGTFNFKLLITVFLLTIGFYFSYNNSIGILAEKIPAGKIFTDLIQAMKLDFKRNPYPLIGTTIIIAPIFEEIIFRSILLEGFLGKYHPFKSIVISSLFFGTIHLNGPQFFGAFFGGLILGTVYYTTKSLILCIAIHSLNNGLALLFELDKFTPSLFGFVIGTNLFFIGLWLFYRMLYKKKFALTKNQDSLAVKNQKTSNSENKT